MGLARLLSHLHVLCCACLATAGGYRYRYCPASEPLTEACFQAHPLAFADEKHTIRYANASRDVEVPATVVKTGGVVLPATRKPVCRSHLPT